MFISQETEIINLCISHENTICIVPLVLIDVVFALKDIAVIIIIIIISLDQFLINLYINSPLKKKKKKSCYILGDLSI